MLDSKDAVCAEELFGAGAEVKVGNQISDPEAGKQYCFRIADVNDEAHHISHYLEEDAFEELSEEEGEDDPSKEQDDEGSEEGWPMAVVIIAAVAVVGLIGGLVFFLRRRRPRFK